MNELLPYEEQLAQQWNDLPLPDENMAWADMKRRLDKDDDDGLIPVWLRGCALWGLVGILVLGLGWWFIHPEKWLENKKAVAVKQETGSKQKKYNQHKSNDEVFKKINEAVDSSHRTRRRIESGNKKIVGKNKTILSHESLKNRKPGYVKSKSASANQVIVNSKKRKTGFIEQI